MNRPDPHDLKYGNPDWCHDAQPDGRKALSSLLAEFREHPDQYLELAAFPGKESNRTYYITDASDHGWPFVVTLHDHAEGEQRLVFKLTHSEVRKTDRQSDDHAVDYLTARLRPCPCSNERVDMWWSLTGRMDQTMFHLALMPEAKYWMQLS